MELKMTDRDKLLLIILVLLLVVFAVVMIPSFGIMASINNIKDYKQKIEAQEVENRDAVDAFVADCEASGISDPNENYANKPGTREGSAYAYIQDLIFEAQYDAVKVSQLSLSAVSTSVAREWLIPLGYIHFENGTDAETLLAGVEVVPSSGYSMDGFQIGYADFDTQNYSCELSCVSQVDAFDYAIPSDKGDLGALCNTLMTYRLLTERGSVAMSAGQGTWRVDEEGAMQWSVILVIPQNSKIEDYKKIVRECPYCATPYSAVEAALYDAGNPMHCEECDNVLPLENN